MMMDGKILELAETRQLNPRSEGETSIACISPDGKYVAYAEMLEVKRVLYGRLCLVRTTDGQPEVIMAQPPNFMDEGFTGEVWNPQITDSGQIVWSPDSGSFAFPVYHLTVGPETAPSEFGMAVESSSGRLKKYFLLDEITRLRTPILWSPDSRRFVCECVNSRHNPKNELLLFDVPSGSVRTLASHPVGVHPVTWVSNGKSIYYTVQEKDGVRLMEVGPDGGESQVVEEHYEARLRSPDGVYHVKTDEGMKVTNRLTGEVTDVISSTADVLGWSPNSKMIVYQRPRLSRTTTASASGPSICSGSPPLRPIP